MVEEKKTALCQQVPGARFPGTMRATLEVPGGMLIIFFWTLGFSLPLLGVVKNDIEFGNPGGVPLMMDAMIQDGSGLFPSIVFVHGGGFTGGDKKGYPKAISGMLTQAGFNWFSVNYRLSPKFTFPAHTDDVELAVAFLKSHAREFKVDPNRIVLMGSSAGGHLVSFVGSKHKPVNRVAAVVSFYGEHDLVNRTKPQTDCAIGGKIRHTDEPQACLSDGLKAFLGITEVNPATAKILREASPITYVKKDMPPYLLIHGTQDYHVPYEQSVLMCDAMQRAEARCEIITVEGGGHGGWDEDPTLRNYQSKLLGWLEQVVGTKNTALTSSPPMLKSTH
jgi:acetyl esterase